MPISKTPIHILVGSLRDLPNWPYLAELHHLPDRAADFACVLGRSRTTKAAIKKLAPSAPDVATASAHAAATLYAAAHGNTHALFGFPTSKNLPFHVHISTATAADVASQLDAAGVAWEGLESRLMDVAVFRRDGPPEDWAADLRRALRKTDFPPPRQWHDGHRAVFRAALDADSLLDLRVSDGGPVGFTGWEAALTAAGAADQSTLFAVRHATDFRHYLASRGTLAELSWQTAVLQTGSLLPLAWRSLARGEDVPGRNFIDEIVEAVAFFSAYERQWFDDALFAPVHTAWTAHSERAAGLIAELKGPRRFEVLQELTRGETWYTQNPEILRDCSLEELTRLAEWHAHTDPSNRIAALILSEYQSKRPEPGPVAALADLFQGSTDVAVLDQVERMVRYTEDPRWTRVARALEERGHTVAADFEPRADSPYHPSVQRFLASSHCRTGASYKGSFGDAEIWMFEPANMGVRNGRLEIGHYDGGNYTVVLLSPDRNDPPVRRFDHEEPDRLLKLTDRLSSLILGLTSEADGTASIHR